MTVTVSHQVSTSCSIEKLAGKKLNILVDMI